MRAMTVSWSAENDETKITLSDEFRFSCRITRLDVLKDTIGMLEIEYGFLLTHSMDNAEQLHETSPKQFLSNEVQRGQEQ